MHFIAIMLALHKAAMRNLSRIHIVAMAAHCIEGQHQARHNPYASKLDSALYWLLT
jgi:hypothetical protein